MAESIEVRYTPIGPGYFHKYIVYTDSNGNQYAARGGPSAGAGYGGSSTAQSGSSMGSSGSPFGKIKTESGRYDPNFIDFDSTGTNPKEVVKSGDDLSSYWQKIKDAMDDINNEGHEYRPLDQNSNSAADEALRRAGLKEPEEDGVRQHWAPGSGNNLPGGSDDHKPNTGGPFTDPNKPYSSPADKNRNGIPDILESAKDKFGQSRRQSSPIILDLDGDGVETTKVNQGVWFDHDGNGYAESTGWVGKDDGLLVRDVDGSGYIDVGSELFGNNTKLSNGQKAANGFEALKDLDAIANGGNADGKLDSNDAAWASLKVWKDANGDGYHSDGEVISLADAGVQSLNVAYTNSTQVDVNGNAHQQLGSFTKTVCTTGKATNVWFASNDDDWRVAV